MQGAALAMSAYGMKRQHDARQNAQRRAVDSRNERIMMANQAQQRQDKLRMAAMQAQSGMADQASEAFRNAAQNQLGNLEQDVRKEEAKQGQSLNQVIDRNVAGEAGKTRQVGSNVKGRVSEDFQARGEKAQAENLADVRQYADRKATIGAFRQMPTKRGEQMSNIGLAVQPHQRAREHQAAMDRLRIQKAGRLPPEQTEYVDPTSPLGEALQGIGQGTMDLYGQGFFDFPSSSSGISGASVTGGRTGAGLGGNFSK